VLFRSALSPPVPRLMSQEESRSGGLLAFLLRTDGKVHYFHDICSNSVFNHCLDLLHLMLACWFSCWTAFCTGQSDVWHTHAVKLLVDLQAEGLTFCLDLWFIARFMKGFRLPSSERSVPAFFSFLFFFFLNASFENAHASW